jgi:hypothetical protein
VAEGARQLGEAILREGFQWHWLPLSSAEPPDARRFKEIAAIFASIRDALLFYFNGGVAFFN